MKKLLFIIYSILCFGQLFAQETNSRTNERNNSLINVKSFTLKGLIEDEYKTPISKAEINVNGGRYTISNALGEFRIQVQQGDEVVIVSPYFETVYYTVTTEDKLTVVVEASSQKGESTVLGYSKESSFHVLIDSAKYYQNSSLEKSISFIAKSIEQSKSTKQNAEAFETLADIYMDWKQYDVAATNYKISLNSKTSNPVNLKLAEALFLAKSFEKSRAIYKSINKDDLVNWEKISYNEGIANLNLEKGELKEALKRYKDALYIAETNKIVPKITDLNSKIGGVYAKMGALDTAEEYYNKTLNAAGKLNNKRKIEITSEVADFQNKTQDYDAEIELRQGIITNVQESQELKLMVEKSEISLQKQNYKIGNAYYLKQNYDQAIPFLEKSIQQASAKKDLVVEKDATKKLSEVFSASKKYTKALDTYKTYTGLVEELYRKKEQEISQALRFSKRITEKQNRILILENERQLAQSQINLSQEKNKRQQFYIYALIGGLFLVMLVAYLMYKYIMQQRLANNLLALKSLRSQMNPHFIFNALNSVNSFIALNDERTANKYLSDFSKLMRAVLENSEEDFIPLEKEIELIQWYTKLEHFRFHDKFDYEVLVEDSILVSEYKIPPMILQPYIENAVWHGLRYRKTKGFLQIKMTQGAQDSIIILIIDNGIGRKQSKALKTSHQKKHNSTGLWNIAKRIEILNEMYKDKISVDIMDNPNEIGTQVRVVIKK